VEIELDLESWPLVTVCPRGRPGEEQMRQFLADYREMEDQRAEPYVLVLDLRYCDKISPAQRKMLTDDMAEPGEDSHCKAMAMIFESKILRGILTAIFWVRRPPYPLSVFNDSKEANAWALEQFASGNHKRLPGWYVQADGTRKRSTAREVKKLMEDAQMSAHIARTESAGLVFLVPRAGPFADRADALLAAERMRRDDLHTRVMRLYDEEEEESAAK
jgi:hypothetical protein